MKAGLKAESSNAKRKGIGEGLGGGVGRDSSPPRIEVSLSLAKG